MAQAGGAYFEAKKGEVAELRALLRTVNSTQDLQRKRDAIKKVIAYMTLGIDVSRLFSEMVLCVETKDLVVKKMVYLYLVKYAQEHADMALMCINTLHRDCNNEDPMVRGLALRSLCSLRLPSVIEYISEPLRKSLTDINSYVRKTGVMGVLKLYNLAPAVVKESNLVDLLYNMIRDPDGLVVANCIMVLNEMLLSEGGMAVNQPLVHHLLGRLNDFNEWGLHQVLELVARYSPADDQEVFNIMNMLDPVLRTTNSGVVLATIKTFIHLTTNMTNIHRQLYERIKVPMLTLLAGNVDELVFCILKHIELLVHRCPGIFDAEYKQFYTKFNEPLHVKYIKVDLLAQLANVNNMADILDELCVYVSEVDVGMARRAIRAIGRVGFKLPGGFESGVFDKLAEFLDLDVDYVQAEAVLVLMDLLRKYPERRAPMLERAQRCLREAEEPAARAALIWLVGEYGSEITEAPYLLESIIDGFDDEASPEVKLALLTASVKVFFQRPPEMHRALGRLLAAATNDIASQEVHDRALFYYRLLKADTSVARAVVLAGSDAQMRGEAGTPGTGSNVCNGFAEDQEVRAKDVLFEEFNSLSVIYGKSERLFIAFDKCLRKPEVSALASGAVAEVQPQGVESIGANAPPPPAGMGADLLGGGAAAPPPMTASVAAVAESPVVSLLPDF